MVDQLTFLMNQYPWIQDMLAIMVICRIIFKPLFSILSKWVELTVEEEDDNRLHDFMKTKKYKMLAFIIDMAASVKLPKIKGK